MSKHTPTPWHVVEDIEPYTVAAADRTVAEVIEYEHDPDSFANARLIVRAVNSHADLLTLAEEFLRISRIVRPSAQAVAIEQIESRIEAVIAKAKGE